MEGETVFENCVVFYRVIMYIYLPAMGVSPLPPPHARAPARVLFSPRVFLCAFFSPRFFLRVLPCGVGEPQQNKRQPIRVSLPVAHNVYCTSLVV